MNTPEPLTHLLEQPGLAAIHATLALHRRILKAVRAALPGVLAGHCQDCVVKPNRLILYLDSPLYSAQLRFHVPQLQQRLDREQGVYFREIQVRNLIPLIPRAPTKPKPGLPSPAVAEWLQAAASGDEADELACALRKLARTIADKHKPQTDVSL